MPSDQPPQPKRVYSKGNFGAFLVRTGKGAGRVGSALFKEFTKSGMSPRQIMAPFGRVYRYYGRHLSEPGKKVAQWLNVAHISKQKKETMMQRMENLGPTTVESAEKRDIVEEELDPMEAQIAKKIGTYRAQKLMKNVHALFRRGSGMHVKKEKVAQVMRGTVGVDKESKESGVAIAESFAPYWEPPKERGVTQPEAAKEFGESEKSGILTKQEVKAGEKALGAEYFEDRSAPFHERNGSGSSSMASREARQGTVGQQHGVSVATKREATGLAKREGLISRLSRLKGFITK